MLHCFRDISISCVLQFDNDPQITLSSTVFEIQAFLCFAFLKIPNGCIFLRVKNSLKLEKASIHRPPVAQKFWRNHSMSPCFRDKSICCVLQFLQKIRKFKMTAIFGGTKLFENRVSHSAEVTLWVKDFIKIALSSTVFEIQAFCVWIFEKIRKFKMATILGK